MKQSEIIVGYCRDFAEDFPGQSAHLEAALHRSGWEVRSHRALDDRFPDSELCVDLPEDPDGRTVLLCQSVTGARSPSDLSLMSLLAAGRCYREQGATRIIAVLPHLAYARHDRLVPGQRRPVMAGLLADLASAAGLDAIVSIASGAQDLLHELFSRTRTQLVLLPAHDLQLHLLREMVRSETVLVAPDAGAAAQVTMLATALDLPLLVADKHRTGPEHVTVTLRVPHDMGQVRHAVVVDDLITSGATVERVAAALHEWCPAVSIEVVATHLRLTASGTRRIEGLLKRDMLGTVHTTDTAGHRPLIPRLTVTPAIPWMAPALAAWLGADLQSASPVRRITHDTRR